MFKVKIENKEKKIEVLGKLNLYESLEYKYVLTDDEKLCEDDKINIVYKQDDLDTVYDLIKDIIIGEGYYISSDINGSIKRINVRKILYFYAIENEVYAVIGNDKYLIPDKLYVLESNLKDRNFVRTSKSFLVNISKIDYVKPMPNYKLQLVMINGDNLEVNRTYRKSFENIFNVK